LFFVFDACHQYQPVLSEEVHEASSVKEDFQATILLLLWYLDLYCEGHFVQEKLVDFFYYIYNYYINYDQLVLVVVATHITYNNYTNIQEESTAVVK
jgi:hypothetical protein